MLLRVTGGDGLAHLGLVNRRFEGQRDQLYNQTFNLEQVSFATESIKDAQQTVSHVLPLFDSCAPYRYANSAFSSLSEIVCV